jgi:hypothetical protein
MEEREKKGGPALHSSHAQQQQNQKPRLPVRDCIELRTQDEKITRTTLNPSVIHIVGLGVS